MASEKITNIVEEIKALTILEVAELVSLCEETFGVSAAAAVAAPVAGGAAAPAVEEKSEFDVVLASYDAAKKMGIIKAVKEMLGLGLKEAKELVDGAPKTLKEAVAKEDAEKIKTDLEALGAVVELK